MFMEKCHKAKCSSSGVIVLTEKTRNLS